MEKIYKTKAGILKNVTKYVSVIYTTVFRTYNLTNM